MNVNVVEGDLLDQDVDVIVNARNRNVMEDELQKVESLLDLAVVVFARKPRP